MKPDTSLWESGDRMLVAVSGGADSMALLAFLHASGADIVAAHFEHGIRGEASRADAAFVEAYCRKQGIPVRVGHGDVPAMAKEWQCSLEDAARRARYAFLDAAADAVGAKWIALAHHMEDQAETLLLHLAHGCGPEGLSGMRAKRGRYIRPLLGARRAEIEAYLRERAIPWREDATNADPAHARNYLRHEIIPRLRRLNPDVSAALARTAAHAARASDLLRERALRALSGRTRRLPYGTFWETEAPDADALRLFARLSGVPPLSEAQTLAVLRLQPNGTANLPGGWRALRTRSRLHLLSPAPASPEMPVFAKTEIDGMGNGVREQAFDAEKLAGAVFRFRREGDVFAPLHGTGTQKLKQTLRDAGIDRPFRDLLPVLARGSHIVWVVGVKPSREAAITNSTRAVTAYRLLGRLPWETDSQCSIQKDDGGIEEC